MKKYVVPLLIATMVLGLALSVLAAGPGSALTSTSEATIALETTAGAFAQHQQGLALSEHRAWVAWAVDHNRAAITAIVGGILSGTYAVLLACTQLGFGFSGTGQQHRPSGYVFSLSIFLHAIGSLIYQSRMFLAGRLHPKREQEEVCYG